MRDIRYIRIAVLSASALLASCAPESDRARTRSGEAVTVRFLPWFEDYHWIDPLLAEFERAHDGRNGGPRIVVEKLQASQEEETLRALIAAGDPPDVFAISYEALRTYLDAGALEPLDPWLAGRGFDREAYYPVTLDALRAGGRQWGLPKDCTPYVFYYNVDALAGAGLERPAASGWTWDTLRDYAERLTVVDERGEPQRYGVRLNYWAQAFVPWIWQAGGDLLAAGPGGHRSAFGADATVAALEFVRGLRDRGLHPPFARQEVHASPRFQFGRGTIALEGPAGRWKVQGLRDSYPELRFDVLPLPRGPAGNADTALAMTAYCVSSASTRKDAAAELLAFLAGEPGARFMGRLGRAVPAIRVVAEEVLADDAERMPAHGREVFLESLSRVRIADTGARHAEIKQAVSDAIESCLLDAAATPAAAAVAGHAAIERVLARDRVDRHRHAVPWAEILAVLGVAWIGGLIWLWSRQRRLGALAAREARVALWFVTPWLIGFSVFVLGPAAVVGVLSLSDWNALTPVASAPWVGTEQYQRLAGDPLFARALAVTVRYTALAIPFQTVAALAIALLLHGSGRRLPVLRAIVYLPSLIGGVALSVLWWRLFDAEGGLLNDVLAAAGIRGPRWLLSAAWVVPSFVLMSLWFVGTNVVIYLAGLASVPGALLDAARVDGAGAWRRFWHVTLPAISPLVLFNVITLLIASFQVFTQSLILTQGGPDNRSLFWVLYLYRTAFSYQEMGYACAMAVALFAVVALLTAASLRMSRRWVHVAT